MRSCRASLRDNATPSALSPSTFCTPLLTILRDLRLPSSFSGSCKEFYSLLLAQVSCIPMLHRCWAPFVSRTFSLSLHWRRVRDNFTENSKNDLAWMISLRAVKVRDSLRNWGYIASSRCASCSRVETIDHCFLNCHRAKNVLRFFLPLLSSLLGHPFFPNCAFVFFYQFKAPQQKKMRLLLFFIKTIL